MVGAYIEFRVQGETGTLNLGPLSTSCLTFLQILQPLVERPFFSKLDPGEVPAGAGPGLLGTGFLVALSQALGGSGFCRPAPVSLL